MLIAQTRGLVFRVFRTEVSGLVSSKMHTEFRIWKRRKMRIASWRKYFGSFFFNNAIIIIRNPSMESDLSNEFQSVFEKRNAILHSLSLFSKRGLETCGAAGVWPDNNHRDGCYFVKVLHSLNKTWKDFQASSQQNKVVKLAFEKCKTIRMIKAF